MVYVVVDMATKKMIAVADAPSRVLSMLKRLQPVTVTIVKYGKVKDKLPEIEKELPYITDTDEVVFVRMEQYSEVMHR